MAKEISFHSVDEIHLITDRTQSDVARVKSLAALGLGRMTGAQKEEYLSSLKGAYNTTDLNRVGAAVELFKDLLAKEGYNINPKPKTDWAKNDAFELEDEMEYLTNVEMVRGVIPTLTTNIKTPEHIKSYAQANDVEKIFLIVNQTLDKIKAEYRYSDDIIGGYDIFGN